MPRTAISTARTAISTPRLAVRNVNAAISAATSVATANNISALDVSLAGGVTVLFSMYFVGNPNGSDLFRFRDASNNDCFRLTTEVTTNKIFTWQTNSGGSGSLGVKPSTFFNKGRWYRMAVTYNGSGTSSISADGVLLGTGSANTCRASSQFLILPSANNQVIYSDVHVVSGVLTAAQIANDYYANVPPSTNILWWKLDEGAGSSVTDFSGNGYTGTISGTAVYVSNTPFKSRQLVNRNLVANGDFEYAPPFTAATTAANRWIDGTAGGSTTNSNFRWAIFTATGTTAVKFDNSVFYAGSNSLKLSITATGSNSIVDIFDSGTVPNLNTFAIPVLPSTSYTATYRMKTNYVSGDSNDGAFMNFLTRTGTAGGISNNVGTKIKTTTDWTLYSVVFTTDATARFVSPRPTVTGSTGTATLIMDAWFDDIELKPTTPVTRTAVT